MLLSTYRHQFKKVAFVSIIQIRFEDVVCAECGVVSPQADLLSYNDIAPPPSSFSYDGTCLACGSENTKPKTSGVSDLSDRPV